MSLDIIMFIKKGCPYCKRAVEHCKKLAVIPTLKIVTDTQETVKELKASGMLAKNSSVRTVPIIFIDGKYIGGSSEFLSKYN